MADIDTTAEVCVGFDVTNGRPVTLGDLERRSGLYVLGKPGMGKTNLLKHLVVHDLDRGNGLFFLDPHGDAIDELLASGRIRAPFHILDPANERFTFGLNLTRCENPESLTARVDTYTKAYNVFYKAFGAEWGPWLQLIIENTLYTFIENQDYTLAEAPHFLLNPEFRNHLVANMRHNPEVVDFWRYRFSARREREQEAQVDAALTRFSTFLGHPYVRDVIASPQTTVDFASILARSEVVFLKLSANLAPDIKRFLGTIVVSELLHAVRSRPPEKRAHFSIYVDEFQNFATEDFAVIITEGRKFGVAPAIAHQERYGQLRENPQVLGATLATANKVIMQSTVRDAQELAPEFARSVAEVAGKEAETVLSPAPVADLWETGHPNKDIMFTRGKWFWIVDALRQNPHEPYFSFVPSRVPDEYMRLNPFLFSLTIQSTQEQYKVSATDLRQGVQLLNTYFYNWMTGKYTPKFDPYHVQSSHELDLLIQIVKCLAGVFGFYPAMQATINPIKREMLQKAYERYFEQQKHEKLREMQIAFDRFRQSTPYSEYDVAEYHKNWRHWWPNKDRDLSAVNPYVNKYQEMQEALRQYELRQPGRLSIPDTFTESLMDKWKRKAAKLGLSGYEIDALFDWIPLPLTENYTLWIETIVKQAMRGDDDTFSLEKFFLGSPVPPGKSIQDWARSVLAAPKAPPETLQEWAGSELLIFVHTCRKTGRILQQHPVKRLSGKYADTVKVERTQQDLINEMAQELANLPPFTAYAKLIRHTAGDEETVVHKIRLPKPFAPRRGEDVSSYLQTGSIVDRGDVERELRERLAKWGRGPTGKPGTKPPPRRF